MLENAVIKIYSKLVWNTAVKTSQWKQVWRKNFTIYIYFYFQLQSQKHVNTGFVVEQNKLYVNEDVQICKEPNKRMNNWVNEWKRV